MGVTSLSMAAAAVKGVGARLATVTSLQCREMAEIALAASDPAAGRAAVLAHLGS
jgi:phosphotransferase system enzyme I (PtsI)